MPKRRHDIPASATVATTYEVFGGFVEAFVRSGLNLLLVIGSPGLSKSRTIRSAIGNNKDVLYAKGGRMTPLRMYIKLFEYMDCPIILDDADDLIGQKLCRQYLKALTETEQRKRLDYESAARQLEEEGIPRSFWTTSRTMMIVNSWDSADQVMCAIESRAHIVHFRPPWEEVYRHAATWFTDQEILDYLHRRLPDLREPDCRILVKALERKEVEQKSGKKIKGFEWQDVIDQHCDDKEGMLIRELKADKSIKSNDRRAVIWCEKTGMDRATFYRRLAKMRQYMPLKQVKRLKCQSKTKHPGRSPDMLRVFATPR